MNLLFGRSRLPLFLLRAGVGVSLLLTPLAAVGQTTVSVTIAQSSSSVASSASSSSVAQEAAPPRQSQGAYRVTRERTYSRVVALLRQWFPRRRPSPATEPGTTTPLPPTTEVQHGAPSIGTSSSGGAGVCAPQVRCQDSAVRCATQAAACDLSLFASAFPFPTQLPAPAEGLMWGVVLLCLLGIARLLYDLLQWLFLLLLEARHRILLWLDRELALEEERYRQAHGGKRRRHAFIAPMRKKKRTEQRAAEQSDVHITREDLFRESFPKP